MVTPDSYALGLQTNCIGFPLLRAWPCGRMWICDNLSIYSRRLGIMFQAPFRLANADPLEAYLGKGRLLFLWECPPSYRHLCGFACARCPSEKPRALAGIPFAPDRNGGCERGPRPRLSQDRFLEKERDVRAITPSRDAPSHISPKQPILVLRGMVRPLTAL